MSPPRHLVLGAVMLAGCAPEPVEAPRAAEHATEIVVPPPAPKPARNLAVVKGVFAIRMGSFGAGTDIVVPIAIDDALVARCLDEARDEARTWFVGTVETGGRFTLTKDLDSDAPSGFAPCLVKVLEGNRELAAAAPAALTVDVRVRPPGSACSGPYCPKADEQQSVGGLGVLTGVSVDDAFGAGGLGLTGIGEGGGGGGESLGTIGTASGLGTGGSHRSKPPKVKIGAKVSGRLPPEVIQRIVRRSFHPIRSCYEKGLNANPTLAGRVSVVFEIGRDGKVTKAEAGDDTTMNDAAVTSCVVGAFRTLEFPKPEGGIVKVRYPLSFTNAESTPSIGGKRLAVLSSTNVVEALDGQGWASVVVSKADAFVVFARKRETVSFVTLTRSAPKGSYDIDAKDTGLTLVGAALTPPKNESVRVILD